MSPLLPDLILITTFKEYRITLKDDRGILFSLRMGIETEVLSTYLLCL